MNNPPVTKYLSAGGQIFCLFLLLVLFLSLVIPLSAILKGLFLAGKGTEGFNFQVLFRDIANLACNDSIQKSILNTFLQAACSTLIAMAVGIPMAFFCAKRKFPGKRILTGLSSVPLCIPPLILVLAFVRFFGMNGFINKIISSITGEKEPALTFLSLEPAPNPGRRCSLSFGKIQDSGLFFSNLIQNSTRNSFLVNSGLFILLLFIHNRTTFVRCKFFSS